MGMKPAIWDKWHLFIVKRNLKTTMLPLNWRNIWDTAFELKRLLVLISGIPTLLSHFQVSHQLYGYCCLLDICTTGMQCSWLMVLVLERSSRSYVLTVSGSIIGLI